MLTPTEPNKLRVLVVDDFPDALETTAMVLRFSGHQVNTASSGAEAIDRSLEFRPDLILLDLAMPGMDGFETARRIRALDLPPPPPLLVAVSGHGDSAARQHAAEAGFDLHLLKPVHPGVLAQIQLLLEDTTRLGERIAQLDLRNRETMRDLAASYVQMGRSMLLVITTTENETTRERCLGKARRICDRLTFWLERYPYLAGIREDVEDLMRALPR